MTISAQVNDLEVVFDPEQTMPVGVRSGAFTLKDQFGSVVNVPFTVTGEGLIDPVALKKVSGDALTAAGYKLKITQVLIAQ